MEDSDFVQCVTDEMGLISGAAYLYWSSSTNFWSSSIYRTLRR